MRPTLREGYCQERVHHSGMFSRSQCQRKAKKDGWCNQHHPDAVAARRKKRIAQWHARDKERERRVQARKDAARNAVLEEAAARAMNFVGAFCAEECGELQRVGEDGCCPTCGSDAMGHVQWTAHKIAATIRALKRGESKGGE